MKKKKKKETETNLEMEFSGTTRVFPLTGEGREIFLSGAGSFVRTVSSKDRGSISISFSILI